MLLAAPLVHSLSLRTDLVYIRSIQVGLGAGDSQPYSRVYQPRSGKKKRKEKKTGQVFDSNENLSQNTLLDVVDSVALKL